jgi:hypothetical protein
MRLFINDRGVFREVHTAYRREGGQWVQISKEQAVLSAAIWQQRQIKYWFGFVALVSIASLARLLLA